MRWAWLPLFALVGCFYVTQQERQARFDLDGDGVVRPTDCDDADPEVGAMRWYLDADGDGFGDRSQAVQGCAPPTGYVADATDCDDASDAVFPGALEVCNGADDDCDGVADNGATVPTWYVDADGDGQGDPDQPLSACDQPAGAVSNADDCDDGDPEVRLGAVEVACNGIDDDCDGRVDLDDEDVDPAPWTWYFDGDLDGWGDADAPAPNQPVVACEGPTGFASQAGDCADGDPLIHPGAVEACNGFDDDCDQVTDPPGSVGSTRYFEDADGDGWGGTASLDLCAQQPGWVPAGPSPDCDDADPCVFPGALEVCNGIDDDCDYLPDDGCVPPDTADTGMCR